MSESGAHPQKKVDFLLSVNCVFPGFFSVSVSLGASGKYFGRWSDVCGEPADIMPEQWSDLKAGAGSGRKKQTLHSAMVAS